VAYARPKESASTLGVQAQEWTRLTAQMVVLGGGYSSGSSAAAFLPAIWPKAKHSPTLPPPGYWIP